MTDFPIVKCGVISGITAASGGSQLPNIPVAKGVILYAPNITFVGQDPTLNGMFYIGGLNENAPYCDNESRPQSQGFRIQWPSGSTRIEGVTNLNQLRACATVSGQYLAYFGVD